MPEEFQEEQLYDMGICREITLHFHEHDIQRLAFCSLSLAIKDNQCIPVCNYVVGG